MLNAKFAPVAPLHLLQDMWEHEQTTGEVCLGDYHLLLAHDVMESDEKKRGFGDLFYDYEIHYGSSPNIIMDNSVVELGDAVDMNWVMEAAKCAAAEIVVVPDAMSDYKGTIEKLARTFDRLDQTTVSQFDFMFVPQGQNLEEFVKCLEAARGFADVIGWIGIPRVATNWLGSRKQLLSIAKAIFSGDDRTKNMQFHLLGFSDNVIDDVECARMGIANGIDSAVPVRAGQKGQEFRLSVSDYGKRGDYWTSQDGLSAKACANMKYYRTLIKAE